MQNQQVNYHHLMYFREIAISGSISNASKKLSVGASSLSLQLKLLEETLGQNLFKRHKKKLILTEAGAVALEFANKIYETSGELVKIFNSTSLNLKNDFRIGIVDSAPKTLAGKVLSHIYDNLPEVFYRLYEGSHSSLVDKLLTFEIDAVLTNQPFDIDPYHIKNHYFGKSPVGIYGNKNFSKDIKEFPADFNGLPFIIPTKDSPLRVDIDNLFLNHRISYELIGEVQDSSVKKTLIEDGSCVAFLPEIAARSLVKQKKIYKLHQDESICEFYWLLFRSRDHHKDTIKNLTGLSLKNLGF